MEQGRLVPSKLKRFLTQEWKDDNAALLRYGRRIRLSDDATMPFPDNATTTITPIWFAPPDDQQTFHPVAGLEIKGYGGILRIHDLHRLQTFVTDAWACVDSAPKWRKRFPELDLKLSRTGQVIVEDRYKTITVYNDTDENWGIPGGDLDCRTIINSTTDGIGMLMREGWEDGTALLLTDPKDFIEKFVKAANDVSLRVSRWNAGSDS